MLRKLCVCLQKIILPRIPKEQFGGNMIALNRVAATAGIVAALALASHVASAQTYPNNPALLPPLVFDVAQLEFTGNPNTDACAQLAAALERAKQYFGSYRGTFDMRDMVFHQTCATNPLSMLPATGDTPIHILLPIQGLDVSATWSWTSNGVIIEGGGEGGTASMNCASGFNGPIFNVGSLSGITYTEFTRLRLNSNGNCSGTMMNLTGANEGTRLTGVTIVGGDSPTATGDTFVCTDCMNFTATDVNVSQSGANNAVTFAYDGSSGHTTQNVRWIGGFYSNTGHENGLAGIYVPGTQYLSQITIISPHCEGFVRCVEVGAATSAEVLGANTSGPVTQDVVYTDAYTFPGAQPPEGNVDAPNVCDFGQAVSLYFDDAYPPPDGPISLWYKYAGHACL
jgi:hypothetical protein